MTPADRRAIATRLQHSTATGTGAPTAVTTAGHSAIACIILAIAIASPGLPALAWEWFWYSALRRPARNLDRIRQLTNGKNGATERFVRLIQDAENNVLTARATTACGRTRKRQAPACGRTRKRQAP